MGSERGEGQRVDGWRERGVRGESGESEGREGIE